MKTNGIIEKNRYRAAILVLAAMFSWIALSAQDFSKDYQEKYAVDKGAVLVIKNKFGAVNCMAWDENSVQILVTVKVEASSQEKANKIFDKIQVRLSGSASRVEGITEMDNINNANFSINYDIKMPRWINLDMYHQFGELYIDQTEGNAKLRVDYGTLEGNNFSGPQTDITLKFSDGEAGTIKTSNLNVEYSNWECKETGSCKLFSRFSEVSLGKTTMLNLDSQYDELDIEQASGVISVSRFSDLEFGKILGDFDFDIEYGELDIQYIAAGLSKGKIRNSFAEASLSVDPKASMVVSAEMEFGELSYPKTSSMNHVTENYTTHIYNGKIGPAATTPTQLTIISKNSDTRITIYQ